MNIKIDNSETLGGILDDNELYEHQINILNKKISDNNKRIVDINNNILMEFISILKKESVNKLDEIRIRLLAYTIYGFDIKNINQAKQGITNHILYHFIKYGKGNN